jgi:subtilisin-like proprotein convertase family protein
VGILGAGGYAGIGESFAVPDLDVASIAIDDSFGNANGQVDPGEPVNLVVTLNNPWRNAGQDVASATATLSSSTPGVAIGVATSHYGPIAAQGSAAGGKFFFTVASSAACGDALHFTMSINSSLGTTSRDFVLRVGGDTGDGTPITYPRTIPGGLAIPDNDLRGVTDSMTITDDLQISKLQFKIDDLPHTFTGDLAVGLKGPNGYGSDMAYIRGFFTGDGDGDNFVNTVFDDAAVNDLNLSGAADAPYTGTWTPAFNSSVWSLFGIPNLGPDPVGQLSRFTGLSSAGTWRVHVSDQANLDTGKLNQWSLIVTPRSFSCTPFAPGDRIFADGFEP